MRVEFWIRERGEQTLRLVRQMMTFPREGEEVTFDERTVQDVVTVRHILPENNPDKHTVQIFLKA